MRQAARMLACPPSPARCAISDVWVDAPRKMPFRCRRTGLDGAADGPFFEESLAYAEAGVGDDRELTLYHSPAWIMSMCSQPGSPLVALTTEQYTDLQAELADAQAERAELALRLEERDAELARLNSVNSAIDVQALTNGLVVSLEEHFAKKSGPKPKQAA